MKKMKKGIAQLRFTQKLPRPVWLLGLFLSISIRVHAQVWPGGIHDPSSIIKCKDKYWIFGTGDGIAAKYSKDMVTWTDGPTPFTNGAFPSWITKYAKTSTATFEGFFWAPDIIYMNGKYYLFYSASVWGTTSSCIGAVVNQTLEPTDANYKWEDLGDLGISSPRSGWRINAIDPALMRGPDNRIWLTYGSFNRDGILITEIDSITAKPKGSTVSVANSWTGGSAYGEGEGGATFYRDGYYYLVYNKGGCCAGIGSSYYMVIGRSVSPQGPFKDKDGKALRIENATSGGTLFFRHDDARALDDRYYGPGHFGLFSESGNDYVSFHYYNPNGYYPNEAVGNKGGPTLGYAMLNWGEDGWPTLTTDFAEEGYYVLENVNSGKVLDTEKQKLDAGTAVFQYTAEENSRTQKWLLKPLGSGEYTIQNHSDTSKYLEVKEPFTDKGLKIANAYTGAVNQKFRLVKTAQDKYLIYPSVKDEILEIPNALTTDSYVRFWANTNHDCQRWYLTPFEANLTATAENIQTSAADSAFTVDIRSNTNWQVEVADESWIQILYATGKGNGSIVIDMLANTETEARTNQVFIKAQTGKELVISIEQKGRVILGNELKSEAFHIFPNPSNGWVIIENAACSNVQVFNQAGQQVAAFETKSAREFINLSYLTSGLYVLKVDTPTGSVSKKLLIK